MSGAATDGDQMSLMGRTLRAVTRLGTRYPITTLLLTVASAIAASLYSSAYMRFETSRADLIDPRADYHQRWIAYTKAFGDVTEDMVVAVEADSPAEIKAIIDELGPRVEQETKYFSNVLYKVEPEVLATKGLQYLNPEQLHAILLRLEEFGPVLKGKWNLFTLKALIRGLRHQLTEAQSQSPEIAAAMTGPLLEQTALLVSSLDQFSQNPHDFQSPWRELVALAPEQRQQSAEVRYLLNDQGTMGFLKAQPIQEEESFEGPLPAIKRMRELLAEIEREYPGSRLGLTGIPVLESDEMLDSQASMTKASVLSFIGVALLLFFGFRGFRHPLLAMAMLSITMAWAFGFTTLAIGHLNILSVSFAAMLVGLGDDFAVVYLSRYLQLRHEGLSLRDSLIETGTSIGPSIITAAITTALAFYAAVFTDFAGIAELGIIAGTGILLCCVAALVTMPAMIALADRKVAPHRLPNPIEGKPLKWLTSQYPVGVIVTCTLLIGFIASYGLRVDYDYNLLHLQAEEVESVKVQNRIFEKADGSLLFAVSLANSPQQALELKRKFEALPTVHHVDEVASMLPTSSPEDTNLPIQAVRAQLSQLPAEFPQAGQIDPKSFGEQLGELDLLLQGLPGHLATLARHSIDQFLDRLAERPLDDQIQLLRDYQTRLGGDLLGRLHALANASNTEPVTHADFPPALASRFVSPQGKWLLQIYPKSQIWDIEPLSAFIADVRSIDPEVTGTPLQTFEASREIKDSYEQAALYSLFIVFTVLLLDFRSVRDALLAMTPPFVGAALMFGILGLLHVDRNPANLIILPLVIGIGVDGGVHMVHDFRSQKKRYRTSPSTLNAIVLTAATSMMGFGSMMIADHRGLYSLGLVLTVGVGSCLFVSTVLLPSILTLVSTHTRRRQTKNAATPLTAPASLTPSTAREVSFPQPPHQQPRLDAINATPTVQWGTQGSTGS